jgi:ornithine cyclodeaminase/alanine dehydrogenase-like protein (mu-crystallin family)
MGQVWAKYDTRGAIDRRARRRHDGAVTHVAVQVLGHAEVERRLPMGDCIEAMAGVLADLARGRLSQPLRSAYVPPSAGGLLVWMPAHRSAPNPVFAVKVLCVVPDNPTRGLDSHQGAVLLMDGVTGELRAVVDAAAITGIRTAAVSAVSTRCLARADARELAIIGTGVQAGRHLQAIPLVRPIRRVRIAGRTADKARAFVERWRATASVELIAADSIEAAVRGADVVVTATTSPTPVLSLEWLSPGAHLCALGASQPPAHEIDVDTVAACALFVDRRDSLEAEAAEWQMGRSQGRFGPDHLRAELGEVLAGLRPGRSSNDEITLFRSLGLAVEDLAAAELAARP